jgi:hypothetical protein
MACAGISPLLDFRKKNTDFNTLLQATHSYAKYLILYPLSSFTWSFSLLLLSVAIHAQPGSVAKGGGGEHILACNMIFGVKHLNPYTHSPSPFSHLLVL